MSARPTSCAIPTGRAFFGTDVSTYSARTERGDAARARRSPRRGRGSLAKAAVERRVAAAVEGLLTTPGGDELVVAALDWRVGAWRLMDFCTSDVQEAIETAVRDADRTAPTRRPPVGTRCQAGVRQGRQRRRRLSDRTRLREMVAKRRQRSPGLITGLVEWLRRRVKQLLRALRLGNPVEPDTEPAVTSAAPAPPVAPPPPGCRPRASTPGIARAHRRTPTGGRDAGAGGGRAGGAAIANETCCAVAARRRKRGGCRETPSGGHRRPRITRGGGQQPAEQADRRERREKRERTREQQEREREHDLKQAAASLMPLLRHARHDPISRPDVSRVGVSENSAATIAARLTPPARAAFVAAA